VRIFSVLVAVLATGAIAHAQGIGASLGVYGYPLNEQDADQQRSDEGYCFGWAKDKTGVDPFAPAVGPPPPAPVAPPAAGAARGAAVGAAGGAALGAIAGSAGRGAAAGSVVGAMSGSRSTRQANAAAQRQQAAQQAAAANAATDQFKQAYASCLSGRGYSVK
jgi:hypothetical protein